MARTRTTTDENVNKENVTGAEATEPAENPAGEPEATKDETVAEAPAVKKSNRVTVVIPRYLFTSDPMVEHHEVCLNGKIYQVKYDEPVEVPKGVADVINNAIAQKKKVQGLISKLNGKAKEIAQD